VVGLVVLAAAGPAGEGSCSPEMRQRAHTCGYSLANLQGAPLNLKHGPSPLRALAAARWTARIPCNLDLGMPENTRRGKGEEARAKGSKDERSLTFLASSSMRLSGANGVWECAELANAIFERRYLFHPPNALPAKLANSARRSRLGPPQPGLKAREGCLPQSIPQPAAGRMSLARVVSYNVLSSHLCAPSHFEYLLFPAPTPAYACQMTGNN